ncbi:hypothetical protein OIU84_010517 [Salix udensis]|uniref:Reverse transcriptase zinc-binding domain-containing protein n=1 Tax=Salix udensis TaxID=889485 RepID=A0AAD6JLK6_9ROSI|nr:hypothetical protein OIU84_010517 [Salix udensis]
MDLNLMWDLVTFQPRNDLQDTYKWNGNSTGKFSIRSVWHQLRPINPKVAGASLLWHAWHIPRFSFILWLAARGRLRTMDRLHGNSQRVCVLCNGHDENHDHLFFGCSFSSSIWLDISSRAQIVWQAGNWSQAWQDIAVRCSNKNNPRHRLVGLALASSIYHIWKERNKRIFDQHFSNSQKIRDDIVNSVCGKLGGLGVGVCLDGAAVGPLMGPWKAKLPCSVSRLSSALGGLSFSWQMGLRLGSQECSFSFEFVVGFFSVMVVVKATGGS